MQHKSLIIIALISLSYLCISMNASYAQNNSDSYVTITGTVKDGNSRKNLGYINVVAKGKNISTVTNGDGYFSLKISKQLILKNMQEVVVSGLGYKNSKINVEIPQNETLVIYLKPEQNLLSEITIYPSEPRLLIQKALEKVSENYSDKPTQLFGFYRETAEKRHKYISLSEAIFDACKSGYARSVNDDKIRILKGRKLLSPKVEDTLAVKLLGGPSLFIYLDVAKNRESILSDELLTNYNFTMDEQTIINERPQYVIAFHPKLNLTEKEEYYGRIFIDKEMLAFSRIEYSLSMEDISKATRVMLFKKPAGLRFKPQEMSFVITYINEGGKYYLNYIRSNIRFKCDWKRRLFSTNYSMTTEMIVTSHSDNNVTKITNKEAFGDKEIFYDKVTYFKDLDFWKQYNIIEPTESLETAIKKIVKQSK
jgi:hypothetical protein